MGQRRNVYSMDKKLRRTFHANSCKNFNDSFANFFSDFIAFWNNFISAFQISIPLGLVVNFVKSHFFKTRLLFQLVQVEII